MAEAATQEPYLSPYQKAAERYGGGFSALLWASPKTQRARFAAIHRACDFAGKSILDAGCGRADLLGYLLERNVGPAEYIGLEAVEALAANAQTRGYRDCQIIRDDFVRNPACLFVGADAVIFSGSLNTVQDDDFYATLQRAYDAAAQTLIFNFLDSPALAGKQYLFWRSRGDVIEFARRLSSRVRVIDDYLQGDCTIAIEKQD